ncbi:hypothetical protein E4U56_007114 [Claviceps arundinis]|uniref:Major facilitator superfamily transporter n=1 Tax=Claviceps arundinis TaxID=1623583 RepID=A0A9P7SRG6_9HYPO|nr:hypothetical protein E4U56_007114 [Claviceps arundinis]
MERTPSLLSLSSCGSSSGLISTNSDSLLPLKENVFRHQKIPPLKVLLGHLLYRRIVLWTLICLAVVGLIVSSGGHVSVSEMVEYDKGSSTDSSMEAKPEFTAYANGNFPNDDAANTYTALIVPASENPEGPQTSEIESEEDKIIRDEEEEEEDVEGEEEELDEDEADSKPWLRYPHLNGYFHGLKSLIKSSKLVPEYPNTTNSVPMPAPPINSHRLPRPTPYKPYTTNKDYIKRCYLDKKGKRIPPDVLAYKGIPQHMPDPVVGSHELLGIRDDVCFDRFGRFGPYGFGYAEAEGGAGGGQDTEKSGSDTVWAKTGKIHYGSMDWGDAQNRCLRANEHRLVQPDADTGELPQIGTMIKGKTVRQAVVVRCYTSYQWTAMAVVNLRALITELSLKSGGEYTVHILLHVLDSNIPIWADETVVQSVLDASIPSEFHGLVTLWSEGQMLLFYPGEFQNEQSNPSGRNIRGVYRAAHLPLQVFASQHPEYEYFWNWEMDMRYLGNYFELFDRVGRWAETQPRSLMWERNERYYIPSYHGSWDNFTQIVRKDHAESGRQAILGPVDFPGKRPLGSEQSDESRPLDDNCEEGGDATQCGVGEGADLITFNPIFEVAESGWVFSNDMAGYTDVTDSIPTRRSCIVTAGRLSRRLLLAMHEEVWRHHRTMFSEMFPASVALHHGFKAIYAPHPISLERAWIPVGSAVDEGFNSGRDHSTSGSNSPFCMNNEHVHKGSTFYFHSEFAGLLWRRWLGHPQMDGRGRDGGDLRGGVEEESRPEGSGRMCLRSMLFHPIKFEGPDDS